MSTLGPINHQAQTGFSIEQAKVGDLTRKLKNHENKKELLQTAREFEGVFFKQLLGEMDKTIDRSGFMSGGSGEEMFRGMMYDEVSKLMATRPGGSGLGIAEVIYRQMEKQVPSDEGTQGGESGNEVKG